MSNRAELDRLYSDLETIHAEHPLIHCEMSLTLRELRQEFANSLRVISKQAELVAALEAMLKEKS